MRRAVWLAGALLLGANPARATAPAPSPQPLRWSIALERLFGVSCTWSNEVDGQRQTSTSLGLGARYLEHPGYGTPLPRLVVWPRAGLTLLLPGRQTSENHRAVSVELPVIWRLPGGAIGLSATPHVDLGFSGGSGSTDERVSEVGLALGANLFL